MGLTRSGSSFQGLSRMLIPAKTQATPQRVLSEGCIRELLISTLIGLILVFCQTNSQVCMCSSWMRILIGTHVWCKGICYVCARGASACMVLIPSSTLTFGLRTFSLEQGLAPPLSNTPPSAVSRRPVPRPSTPPSALA